MNEEIAKNAKLVLQGRPSRVSMASDNLSAPVIGKVCSNLLLQGRDYPNVTLSVMPGLCADVVLGQDFLRQHKEVVIKLGGPKKSLLVGKDSSCDVAASEVKCDRLLRNLKPECRLIATKSRKFNEEDKRFIDAEVRKLLLEGIIEPSYSPWRAQVLVARNERHKARMVVDYSQTVNRFTLLDAYPLPNIDEQIAEIAKASVFSTLDLKSAYYQLPLHPKDRPFTAFEAGRKLYQYTRLPFGVTNGVSFFQRFINFVIEKYQLSGTYAYLDNITVCGVNNLDHDAKLKALLCAARNEGLTFNENKCTFNQKEINLLGYRVSHAQIKPDPERLRPLLEMPLPQTKPELQRALGMFSYYARWIPNFSSKIRPLVQSNVSSTFPLSLDASQSFSNLLQDLAAASVTCIQENVPFVVECDASEYALAATLNQRGQPVAFHSRTFSNLKHDIPPSRKRLLQSWTPCVSGATFYMESALP